MLEKNLQREIMSYLRLMGHWVTKSPAGMIKTEQGRMVKLGDAGACDLTMGIRESDHWEIGFIECKLPDGRLSYRQWQVLRDHHLNSRRWCIVTDVTQVDKFLHQKDYHGDPKFVAEVLNDKKSFPISNRVYTPKPNPYQPLIDARDERMRKQEEDRPLPPF